MTAIEGRRLKILELYSGIGGMRAAALGTGADFDVVGTFEISTTAMAVYCHNFPQSGRLKCRNVLGLKAEEFSRLNPDILLMSPPCQPYTRQGLKRDIDDERSSSLLHVLSLLERVESPPEMICLENVAGFETSLAHERLLCVAQSRDYEWQEFLITPLQFGIPNSRLRYYFLALRKPRTFKLKKNCQVQTELPVCICYRHHVQGVINPYSSEVCSQCGKTILSPVTKIVHQHFADLITCNKETSFLTKEHPLPLFLFLSDSDNVCSYLLSDKVLQKYARILDIVTAMSTKSCCFTRGYGHYVEGTGSVIQSNCEVCLDDIYTRINTLSHEDPQRVALLSQLQLRYFRPAEILKILCFPSWFQLPQVLSNRQLYAALGNSINVLVVSALLCLLFE